MGFDTSLEASGDMGLMVLEELEDRGHFQKQVTNEGQGREKLSLHSGSLWRMQQGSVG